MNMQREEFGATASRRPALLWWDLGVAATIAAMGVIGVGDVLFGDEPGSPFEVVSAVGVLALLAAWYVGLGRAALRRAVCDEAGRRVDYVYLLVLVLIIGAATVVVPSYATLQTIGYPMIWTVVSRYRDAVIWSAALALCVGTGFVFVFGRSDLLSGLSAAAVVVVLSFVFAVAMGTWITRIFEQGERYRLLAEQLRASQAEVSALSEQAGAGRERERLSRELHDTLTQTLAGLVMLSEQADRALAAGDTDRARDRVARVESAARDAVAEARALVATTQPLGDGGLEAAIERVVARLRADAGLDVSCEVETVQLDRERQVVLLRAVQEGLANARRHAGASQVHVRLVALPGGGALLHVDDDGVGPTGGVGAAVVDGVGGVASTGTAAEGEVRDAIEGAGAGAGAGGAGAAALAAERVSAAVRGETGDAGAGAGAGGAGGAGVGVGIGAGAGAGGATGGNGGFGLSGLAARARGVGGVVVFGASPLGGARLEVLLDAERAERGASA